jgi:hypothetical protein
MSRRFISIAAGAVAFATGGTAFAADKPVQAPPAAPAPVLYTWIGFYIRASAGPIWSWNDVEPSATVAFTNPGFSVNAPSTAAAQIAATPPALSTGANGFIGGGQLGRGPKRSKMRQISRGKTETVARGSMDSSTSRDFACSKECQGSRIGQLGSSVRE